jgi:DNA processing protein
VEIGDAVGNSAVAASDVRPYDEREPNLPGHPGMSIDPQAATELSLFGPRPLTTSAEGETVPRVRRHTAVVALGEIQGVGHMTAIRLYDSPNFDSLFTATRDEAHWIASSAGVERPHAFADALVENRDDALRRAAETLEQYEDRNVTLVLDRDPTYPDILKTIPDPPRWLFVRGNVSILSSQRLITVVGTRKPTDYGIALAIRVAELLVKNDFVIVSGLAEGIDGAVHDQVVKMGGQTVAILGTGLENNFPQSTSHLRNPIVKHGGAIVTEYFNKEQYSRQRFVQRNRIQAALSQITVPVEAGVPSGTLHTIRFADQFGRLVIGVRTPSVPETALHSFLREHGFPVVDVPESDDPFMAAVGTKYRYQIFGQVGERERRVGEVDAIIKYVRARAKRAGLGEIEIRQIVNGISGKDDTQEAVNR